MVEQRILTCYTCHAKWSFDLKKRCSLSSVESNLIEAVEISGDPSGAFATPDVVSTVKAVPSKRFLASRLPTIVMVEAGRRTQQERR